MMNRCTRPSLGAVAALLALLLCVAPIASARHSGHHGESQRFDGLSNATVLIIRHAEKPGSGSGLGARGQQRANAYAAYFDPFRLGDAVFVPSRLIATKESKSSNRPALTLEPLARRLNLTVDQQWSDNRTGKLAKSLRRHNAAPVILIAWHHGQIFDLINALGGHAENIVHQKAWPGDVYDWVVVMRFDARGKLITSESQVVQEHLLPGDGSQGSG